MFDNINFGCGRCSLILFFGRSVRLVECDTSRGDAKFHLYVYQQDAIGCNYTYRHGVVCRMCALGLGQLHLPLYVGLENDRRPGLALFRFESGDLRHYIFQPNNLVERVQAFVTSADGIQLALSHQINGECRWRLLRPGLNDYGRVSHVVRVTAVMTVMLKMLQVIHRNQMALVWF